MYKGIRLSDYKWEGGSNFEQLVTWGILPAMGFVDTLDNIADNGNYSENCATPLVINELKCKLEDIKATIYRFMAEMREEEKAPESAQPSTDSEAGE